MLAESEKLDNRRIALDHAIRQAEINSNNLHYEAKSSDIVERAEQFAKFLNTEPDDSQRVAGNVGMDPRSTTPVRGPLQTVMNSDWQGEN